MASQRPQAALLASSAEALVLAWAREPAAAPVQAAHRARPSLCFCKSQPREHNRAGMKAALGVLQEDLLGKLLLVSPVLDYDNERSRPDRP